MRSDATETLDASRMPAPELAVQPAEGERVALVEVDSAWEGRPLGEIHQALSALPDEHGELGGPRTS
jgi:hypothetical protein